VSATRDEFVTPRSPSSTTSVAASAGGVGDMVWGVLIDASL
jgi:hypothetical protein